MEASGLHDQIFEGIAVLKPEAEARYVWGIMRKSIEKFLEFNGKVIYFQGKEGQWWIAIKPICEALGVNYDRQYKNLKESKLGSQLYAIQHMVGADNKLRKMVSLPERFIYGWIFRINSDSEDLVEYQIECCNVLYDYFHGSIGGRKQYLATIAQAAIEREDVLARLEKNEDYKRDLELQKIIKQANAGIKKADKELLEEQLYLFREE